MANTAKVETVERIAEKLRQARGVYFTQFLGLDVGEMTELRRQFFKDGVEFEVVKNTLARRSVEKAGFEGLQEVFKGPTAIAFSTNDPASPAKILARFLESHDLPEVKALIFEGEVMDKGVFARIASLPSREQIFAKFMGLLRGPMTQIATVLKGTMGSLVTVLNQIKVSKES